MGVAVAVAVAVVGSVAHEISSVAGGWGSPGDSALAVSQAAPGHARTRKGERPMKSPAVPDAPRPTMVGMSGVRRMGDA